MKSHDDWLLEALHKRNDILAFLPAKNPKLVFGLSNEFKGREDGWLGLKRTYQLPHEPKGMDHDIAYRGLEGGTLHVTDLNSTDSDIRFYKLRVLEDDRTFFPAYQCVILYGLAFEKQHPEVVTAWKTLEGKFDDASMVEMNAQVKLDRRSERQVASSSLRDRLQIEIARESTSNRLFWELLRTTRDHLQLVTISLLAAVIVAWNVLQHFYPYFPVVKTDWPAELKRGFPA